MDLLDLEDRKRARMALAELDGCRNFPKSAHQQVFSWPVQLLGVGNYQNNWFGLLSCELRIGPLDFFNHQKHLFTITITITFATIFAPHTCNISRETLPPPCLPPTKHLDLARASMLLYHHHRHRHDTHERKSAMSHFQPIVFCFFYERKIYTPTSMACMALSSRFLMQKA